MELEFEVSPDCVYAGPGLSIPGYFRDEKKRHGLPATVPGLTVSVRLPGLFDRGLLMPGILMESLPTGGYNVFAGSRF